MEFKILNLYSNNHFSISMLSVSAVKDKAVTSKSKNL
ncbi:unknown [Prevotella sp. CAG:924]|nr:unknown [Prevotella sp. CAG:924]